MTPESKQNKEIIGLLHEQDAHAARSDDDLHAQFAALRVRVEALEKTAGDIHSMLQDGIGKDLREMVEMFDSLKGGLKVLGWIGGAAKWVAGILAMFAGIYAFVQNIKGLPK